MKLFGYLAASQTGLPAATNCCKSFSSGWCKNIWAGGRWYGPGDPATFMDQTHKLERHYEEFLFGDASVRGQNVARRRPIAKAARVTAPIAFFQGGKEVGRLVGVNSEAKFKATLAEMGVS